MINFKNDVIVFSIGAVCYGMTEILYRGYTHWTMVLTGGLCLLLSYIFNSNNKNTSYIYRCVVVWLIILISEFLVGCIVNLWLGWNVWDYSREPFNFMGQICLMFSFLWLLMSIFIVQICNLLEKELSNNAGHKPEYS
ncbi:MAG: hypothetical protein RR205_05315 [Oscillospiraceae bacterium]